MSSRKMVPFVVDVKAIFVVPPLQKLWVNGVAVMLGVGLTIILNTDATPGQLNPEPVADGVTVINTVSIDVPVLVIVCTGIMFVPVFV